MIKIDKGYAGLPNGRLAQLTGGYLIDGDRIFKMFPQTEDIASAVVTLGAALTYNGSAQTMKLASVVLDGKTLAEGTDYTVSGNTGTNAGSYTLTVTGIGDYEGTATKAWSIAKATGKISVSPTTIDILGPAGTTSTAKITYTGDGAISVASSATGVATVSRSGKTVTVTAVASGSATITITMAAGTNYKGASCTISVGTTVIGTLESTSWATIKSVAASGANYWSIGDRKGVAVSGTVGEVSLNDTYYVYILGFNHNSSIEGNGIHFQFGFTAASGGVNIAFCDSYYLNTGSSAGFRMNTANSYDGGWIDSYMHKTICPAFLNTLPSELQNAISACTKYTDNEARGVSEASYVTASSSNIWIPSEFEVEGTITQVNTYEQNYQKQYAYYANGNSKIKYKSTSTSTTSYWWLRSPSVRFHASFSYVLTDGEADSSSANYSLGFAPCFKVA